jgi:uncharacterized membrane protein YkvA (DUF1232 family)
VVLRRLDGLRVQLEQLAPDVKLFAVGEPLVIGLVAAIALYAAAVGALVVAGRRTDAAVLARFVPDCVVLVRRLLRDPRVPWRSRIVLAALLVYLLSPIDLVPDFVPVAGQLDDALLLALALRHLVRAAGVEVVRTSWPGPERSLRVVLRLAHSPGGWRTT